MDHIKESVINYVNKIEALQKQMENSTDPEQIKRRIETHKNTIYKVLKVDYIENGGTEKDYMEFVNSLLNKQSKEQKQETKQEQPKETPDKTTEHVSIIDVIKEINDYEFYKFEDETFKLLSQLYNVLKLEVIKLLELKPSMEKYNKREYVDQLVKLFMEGMDKWTATNKGYNDKNWLNNLYHAQLLYYLIEYDKAMDNFRKDILNYIHSYTYD